MSFILNEFVQGSFCPYIRAYRTLFTCKNWKSKDNPEISSFLPIENSKIHQKQLLLTEACIKKLNEVCTDGNFLRLTVEGGGCSGFQYKFALDIKQNQDDVEFGKSVGKVVIDRTSLEFCAGATLDYHIELIRSGFRIIENPQAERGCSCGASFTIKVD